MTRFTVKRATIDAREYAMTDDKPDAEEKDETADKKLEPAEDVEAHVKKYGPSEKKYDSTEKKY
jgi:hypothetical protein